MMATQPMAEQDQIESIAEACAILSEGLDALATAQRLGTVRSDAYGGVEVERTGWTGAEVRREPSGAGVNHVILIPAEKPMLSALAERFGAYQECAPISPFQPPRVAFRVSRPDRPLEVRMLAYTPLDDNRKPDGTVSKLMLIPQTKS